MGHGGFWPCREAGGFEPRKVHQAQTVPELNASPAPQRDRNGMAGHGRAGQGRAGQGRAGHGKVSWLWESKLVKIGSVG